MICRLADIFLGRPCAAAPRFLQQTASAPARVTVPRVQEWTCSLGFHPGAAFVFRRMHESTSCPRTGALSRAGPPQSLDPRTERPQEIPFRWQTAGRGSGLCLGTVRKQLFQWGTALSHSPEPPSCSHQLWKWLQEQPLAPGADSAWRASWEAVRAWTLTSGSPLPSQSEAGCTFDISCSKLAPNGKQPEIKRGN